MKTIILVGTGAGLWAVGDGGAAALEPFAGRDITAVIGDGRRIFVLADGRSIWATDGDGRWRFTASVDGPAATCLAVSGGDLFVGTEQAHLWRLTGTALEPVRALEAGTALEPVTAFESVDGRAAWYTPWGDPADVRSIAVGRGEALYVNVHVGGVVRSRDAGRSWTPTLDIGVDVHQVLAHPEHPGVVLVAAAAGFGASRDGGDSWDFSTEGMHAHYLRAVAVAGDTLLVSASTGPGGRRSAVYRRRLDGAEPFERCRAGLPEWFRDNIDTACLAASGSTVVIGTSDGRIFRSRDAGVTWELAAKDLPEVHCVLAA